ncbi:alpha/beta fold hydrolase [Vagococcus fluvialis]|uniref:alpha/beta fold hydrolase n=1 Tax=Vagococcus fluvialis TaxID=2738 RepID=UPI003B58B755
MNVLIIGSTGFIGSEIVKQLAQKEVNLVLLVRNKQKSSKLKELNPSKIQLITGDLTLPNLDLSDKEKQIALSCDSIIHCGGPMDISLSKEDAKTAFLNGAKHVAQLATEINKTNKLTQFIHVVGYMSPFTDNPKDWENYDVFSDIHPFLQNDSYYEQMKFQADILMRQSSLIEGFPLTIINPPTVIGNKDTGVTEQLAGFGLFIKIIRQGLLPIIPGGKSYRLPVINRDVLANFIIETLFQSPQQMVTYTLVKDKQIDLAVPDLMKIVSTSMNMNRPKITIPLPFLKTIMTLGGSRITGISKDSLNFITNRDFDNQQIKKDYPASVLEELSAEASIPLVVADIDYTLTFGKQEQTPFIKKVINQTCFYHLEGQGEPIVLVNGLFSEAADLFPLGIELHAQTNRSIWLVDLPGFGRSPFKPHQQVITPYLEVIQTIQKETNRKATFIGHSFGAALLLEASRKNILSNKQKLILIQPPLAKRTKDVPMWLGKIALKTMSTAQLTEYFMKQGLFSTEEHIPDTYFNRLKKSFNSPRLLNTNLLLNKALHQMTFEKTQSSNISSIWGIADSSYEQPNGVNLKRVVPFGHHFPISEPVKTAEYVLEFL